jgi:hypothetical protein
LQKPKSFLEFVRTKEEKEIAVAVNNSVAIHDLKDPNEILRVITEWRIYIGVPKNEDISEELSILAKFLYEQYGHLTIEEIRLAYNLSVTRKLQDVEFYGMFSPLYVGKVLDSYLYYRKLTMADVIRAKEKHDQELKEQQNRPSPEQQCESTKAIVNDLYKQYKETGEIRDVFNICYNFLRKHDMLVVTKEDIALAMEYGKKMVQSKEKPLMEKIKESDRDLDIKRGARNWCVQNYFENVNIDVLLNNIKPNLFN